MLCSDVEQLIHLQGTSLKFLFQGEGGFGAVYEVSDMTRPGMVFALKVESNVDDQRGLVPLEVTVLRALRNIGAKHFPGYESCGQNEKFNYVIMGLVGENISKLRKAMPHKRFSLHSCLHIGIKSLLSIEEIHRAGYLHRDLKPANMCIGRAPNDLRSLYIVDFGLCRQYINSVTMKPHRPRVRAVFRGTPRYASANALQNMDQGRVDDMWSWFFTLSELLVGFLPWDDMTAPNDTQSFIKKLGQKKIACIADMNLTCQGCPKEFGLMYKLLIQMQFPDKPEYTKFERCLGQVRARKNLPENTRLDWEPYDDVKKFGEATPNAANYEQCN